MTIEERLTKLERRNRYLALTLGVLMVCSVLLGFTAQAKEKVPDVLRAKSFEVVDAAGKKRAVLVAYKGAGLALFDAAGDVRAALGVTEDGPSLFLVDDKGKKRAVLGATETETPSGKKISYPESSLILFDPDGNVTWTAP